MKKGFKHYQKAAQVARHCYHNYYARYRGQNSDVVALVSRPSSTARFGENVKELAAPTLEKLESSTYVYTCCMKYCMRVQPHTYCIYVYTYIYIYINAVGYSLAPKAMLTQNIAGVRPFSTRHHIHAKASYVRMCMPGVLRQNIVAVRLCSTRHGYSHPDRSWR